MCLPPFSVAQSTILMDIDIILEPVNGLQKKRYFTLNNLISTILEEMEFKMAMLISRDVKIHNIEGSLLLKNVPEETPPDTETVFLWEDLQNVTLQTKILIDHSEIDLLTTILDFTLVFTNISIFSSYLKVKFSNMDHFDESERLSNSLCSIYPHRPTYKLCLSQYSNSGLNFKIARRQQDAPFNFSVIISIEPEPFCPRVALPKYIFTNCNKSEFVTNLYTRDFMSKLLSENETHMFFCHEDYFQHLSDIQLEIDMIKVNRSDNGYGHAFAFVTMACLSISLFSLTLTLAVYAVFPVLRSLPGLVNMALVTSLILFQLITVVRTFISIKISWLCSLLGAFTHFFFVFAFAWMFVCTFHMFKVFAQIRNRSVGRNEVRKFASYCIFTTGITLALVTLTIIVSLARSDGMDIGYGGSICYIKDPPIILVMVTLPIALVIISNIAMYCVVAYKILKCPTLASSNPNERQNITIFAKLSTLTGMTWIFCYIYMFTKIEAFAYACDILNAGQGVFIMLSFICNRRIFNMICKKNVKITTTRQTTSTTDV